MRFAVLGALIIALPGTAAAQGRMSARLQRMLGQADQAPNAPAPPEVDGLAPWLKHLHELVPQSAADYADFDADDLAAAAAAVEQWCWLWERVAVGLSPEGQLGVVGRLHDVKQSIDRQLDNVLSLRVQFAALPADVKRHEALRRYLRSTSTLIDLSGRLRYALIDAVDAAAIRFSTQSAIQSQLIDLLMQKHSSVGAQEMADDLFDPPQTAGVEPPPPLPAPLKLKVIQLIAKCGTIGEVDELAEFLLNPATPPSQVLAAAEAIRALGLPQDPRAEQDASLPQPPITAARLLDRLQQIDSAQWTPEELPRVNSLLRWLPGRVEPGLEGNTYRLGNFDVQPGDWLLMRNPSPYNLFTDLSPGLFTHVGVVTIEHSSDGKRRMVVADLPERGTSMPATNVETFLDRTLNYVFLRHPDPEVARKMGEAAAEMIGNPTQFDLNFRTDRITALAGKPLHGEKIHTYCAGLLLLCAQQTGVPRDEFFPITETTAPGHTQENLAKLGLSLGDGFVSPSGALFSQKLEIVGRCEPMYDAPREIARSHLRSLRHADGHHPVAALARCVSGNTLENGGGLEDQSAFGQSFGGCRRRKRSNGPGFRRQSRCRGRNPRRNRLWRQRRLCGGDAGNHRRRKPDSRTAARLDSAAARRAGKVSLPPRAIGRNVGIRAKSSPGGVRTELLRYYIDQGRRQLDERFFGGEKPLKVEVKRQEAINSSIV